MSQSIEYTLRFDSAAQHYVDIEMRLVGLASTKAGALVLSLPVWTPGSYMVREYARHIDAVHAFDAAGAPLALDKTRKNQWRVTPPTSSDVTVRYRVYGREMTVRTNWIEAEFALINGAPTFLSLPDMAHVPHKVRFVLPQAWKQVVCALQPQAEHAYVASHFDELVDTPWLLGNPHTQTVHVCGKEHVLASIGGGQAFDYERALADTARIIAEHHALWGQLPYDRYVFINLLTEGRGGLEHKDSSVLMASPHASGNRTDYVDWLGLVSHEFFHVWNIKRLRPAALGPFDYDNEAPTPSLWIAEGLTAYYDDLQVHRARLSTRAEYLTRLSRAIESVQQAPGRRVQTLAQSSYDAWIKFYRRDENSDNTSVSYYLKGSIVGFLLDAQLRRCTDDKANLDTLMRLAYSRFSGAAGYSEAQFRLCASEVAQNDLAAFFSRCVDSCEELDFAPALDWYGLQFGPQQKASNPQAPPAAWIGVSTRNEGGRIFVSQVLRDTPAYRAGLNVDDEMLFWDDFRVTAPKWSERLRQSAPNKPTKAVISRRERQMTLCVTPEVQPQPKWHLEPMPEASAAQKARLDAWLRALTTPAPDA